MRLSRPFFILMIAASAVSASAFADDVCELRPDLCGAPTKGKKVKRPKNYKSETAREADELERELILEQQERSNSKRRAQQPRPSSVPQARDEDSSKPLGFSQIHKAPNSHQSMRDFGRKHRKPIDRSTASEFDAYLNANAHDPALTTRMPASQSAFQPAKGSPALYKDRPDPVTKGGGFDTSQGPYPQNGGFSSKPVTLEQPATEKSGNETSPAPEGAQESESSSSAGPLH